MSDVGDVAQAVTWIGKIVHETLYKSKRELIEEAYAKAEKDVELFACELLAFAKGGEGAGGRVQLMLDGLVFGIKVNLTASDAECLRGIPVGNELDLYDLLGLYARSRGAEFCQKVTEVLVLSE